MSAAGNNRLAVLAAEIHEADDRFRRSSTEAAAAALDAGARLIEAKALLKHGQWLPWLRDHVAMSERTAQLYMRLAKSGLDIRSVADLGVKAAAEALARHGAGKPDTDYDFGIPIDDVVFVSKAYPRAALDLEYVRELSEVLDRLPPIEINQNNELIDGRHRWEAHKAYGLRRIRVIVTHTDDFLQHMMLACERNSRHGQRETQADRERNRRRRADLDALKATAYVPSGSYERHPIAACFPMMTEQEFSGLCDSIVDHGLIHPIVLFEKQILDGWQRELACRKTGVEPRYEKFAGDWDAACRYAISANVKRQHLDESQRAWVAAKVAS